MATERGKIFLSNVLLDEEAAVAPKKVMRITIL
jgi:hypothetical protein